MVSLIFFIGDVGDIGVSNCICGVGDVGYDVFGVEDLLYIKVVKWVDGILMFVVRKMCIDSKILWLLVCCCVGIEDFCFYDFRYIWVSWLI